MAHRSSCAGIADRWPELFDGLDRHCAGLSGHFHLDAEIRLRIPGAVQPGLDFVLYTLMCLGDYFDHCYDRTDFPEQYQQSAWGNCPSEESTSGIKRRACRKTS